MPNLTIKDRINRLDHLQIRQLTASALEESSKSSIDQASDPLKRMQKFWDDVVKADAIMDRGNFINSVRESIKCSYNHFVGNGLEAQSLKGGIPFITHLDSHFESSPTHCAKVMLDFSNYVCHLSLRDKEQQETALLSFPPEREYLNCLDGSEERIEDLQRDLLSRDADYNLLLGAHVRVMAEFRKKVEHHVPNMNMVHINSCLEYAFGLKRDLIPHAQSQIPAEIMIEMSATYADRIKARLIERTSEIDDIVKTISEDYPSSDLSNFQFDDPLFGVINARLKPYEVRQKSFVGISKDGESCAINQDLLSEANAKISQPLERYLDHNLQQNIHSSSRSEDKTTFDRFIQSSQNRGCYNEENVEDIFSLLRDASAITPEKEIDYESLSLAFEALSIMGDHYSSNSPYIFKNILDRLAQQNGNGFFASISDKVLTALPNYQNHLNKIKENYLRHQDDPLLVDSEESNIRSLLYCGAPKDVILRKLDATGLSDIIQSFMQPQSFDSHRSFDVNCANLIARPDRIEIFEKLRDRINSHNAQLDQQFSQQEVQEQSAQRQPPEHLVLPKSFINSCLTSASSLNDFELASFILNNFKIDNKILEDTKLLKYGVSKMDNKLSELFIGLHDRFYELEERPQNLLDNVSRRQENSMSAVLIAAEKGNVAFFESLINAGLTMADIDSRNVENGKNIIHRAARAGHQNLVAFLVKNGISASQKDTIYGNTPAHYAVANGHVGVINRLINDGVEADHLNEKNSHSATPFETALLNSKSFIVLKLGKFLLDHGKIRLFEEGKPDLIHVAVYHGLHDVISPLQAIGCDINQKNSSQNVPLNLAVINKDIRMVKELIGLGADCCFNKEKKSAIDFANETADINLIKAVLFTADHKTGDTFLHKFSDKNSELYRQYHPSFPAMLMKHYRLDLNQFYVENKEGENAIIRAARELDHPFLISLQQCANEVPAFNLDLNKPNSKGHPPIYTIASRENAIGQIRFLQDYGAKINHTDDKGNTALHLAVMEGNLYAVKNLLEAEINYVIENHEGKKAEDLVHGSNSESILQEFCDAKNKKEADMIAREFHEFMQKGSISDMERIYQTGKVEVRDSLVYAVQTCSLEVVKFLVERLDSDPLEIKVESYRLDELVSFQKKQDVVDYLHDFSNQYKERKKNHDNQEAKEVKTQDRFIEESLVTPTESSSSRFTVSEVSSFSQVSKKQNEPGKLK